MPRGNDKDEQAIALHELGDAFGEGVGNAEELINGNAALRTAELAAISILPVIQADTDALNLDDLEGPNGEYVVDACVRGAGRTKGTIVVFETEDGRTLKHLAESNYDDKPSSGPRRASAASADVDDEDDEAKSAKKTTAPAKTPAKA
ncbi:MAG: hypothetical protein ABW167_20610 [Baekduia sp.]